MPTEPDVRKIQWATLDAALSYLTLGEGAFQRGDFETGFVLLGDVRRALGQMALLTAEGPDAIGYAKLLGTILTEPEVHNAQSR